MGCYVVNLLASSKNPEIELIAALPMAMSTPMNCVSQKGNYIDKARTSVNSYDFNFESSTGLQEINKALKERRKEAS